MLDVFPLSRRARALCGVFTVCCIAMACRQAERLQAVGDHFRWAHSHFHLSQIPLSMFAVSLLHLSQKQCSYDTSMSAESSDHSCNKRPWQSKLGQQGHNKKKRKDTSMSAERIISNTSAALAENNVSGELEGEKDPYLHYSFPSAPSYITSQKWTECTIIHGIKMSSYMYDVYRMTPLGSG